MTYTLKDRLMKTLSGFLMGLGTHFLLAQKYWWAAPVLFVLASMAWTWNDGLEEVEDAEDIDHDFDVNETRGG